MTKLGERILISLSLFFMCVFLAALYTANRSSEKRIEKEETVNQETKIDSGEMEETGVIEDTKSKYELKVSLTASCSTDEIYFQENQAEKSILFFLPDTDAASVLPNQIVMNPLIVAGVSKKQQDNGLELEIRTISYTECTWKIEGKDLCVSIYNIADKYDEIIAIGGLEGEEIQAVNDMADSFSKKTKILLTDDVNVVNEVRADAFLIFDQEMFEKEQEIVLYNDDYFIPDFDSKALCETVVELYKKQGMDEVTGVYVQDEQLQEAMVPTVLISGYAKKNTLLIRDFVKKMETQ